MRVFHGIQSLHSIKNPVLTIGTFDGVHLGHQRIIQQLNSEAAKIDGESVLFTFEPHPRMVLDPQHHGIKLIQSQEEKIASLDNFGLKNVILYPFTKDFSNLTAEEFVEKILVEKMGVKKLVIGYDHQFGKNREGNLNFLIEKGKQFGFEVVEIPAQDVDEVKVSSTKVREAIKTGNIEQANSFLGHTFLLSGEVIHGNKLGRTIGYPTANIHVFNEEKLIPANGVYAVKVELENGRLYPAMMNIGIRPTIQGDHRLTIEVHLFDFDADLYGRKLSVHFLRKWRDEQKFSGIEELKAQLKKDENEIRTFLIPS